MAIPVDQRTKTMNRLRLPTKDLPADLPVDLPVDLPADLPADWTVRVPYQHGRSKKPYYTNTKTNAGSWYHPSLTPNDIKELEEKEMKQWEEAAKRKREEEESRIKEWRINPRTTVWTSITPLCSSWQMNEEWDIEGLRYYERNGAIVNALLKNPLNEAAALAAAHYGGGEEDCIELVAEDIKFDPNFLEICVKFCPPRIDAFVPPFLLTKKLAATALSNVKRHHHFSSASSKMSLQGWPQFKNDRSLVLAAAGNDGTQLQHASSELQHDVQIVLAAVTQSGDALQFASESLQNDVQIVAAAVAQSGDALQFASESLQKHPQIVAAALAQSKTAIRYVFNGTQQNKDFIIAAIKDGSLNWDFFQSMEPNAITKDRDIMNAALSKIGSKVFYTFSTFASERDTVLHALNTTSDGLLVFGWASAAIREDRELVLHALSLNHKNAGGQRILYEAFKHFAHLLNTDRDVVLEMLKTNSNSGNGFYHQLKIEFQNDVDIALATNGLAIRLHQHFAIDKSFVLRALAKCEQEALDFANKENVKRIFKACKLKDDVDVVFAAVKLAPFVLVTVGEHSEIRDHFDIVLMAVRQNGLLLAQASERLKNNKEIVTAALESDFCENICVRSVPAAMRYLGSEIKKDQAFIANFLHKCRRKFHDFMLELDKDPSILSWTGDLKKIQAYQYKNSWNDIMISAHNIFDFNEDIWTAMGIPSKSEVLADQKSLWTNR